MKKKLLVFGCSYADKSYVEITTKSEKLKEHMYDNQGNLTKPFDFWPEILAKELDLELVNFAQCGFGNDGIHSTFMDEISRQQNIGLVVVMWSEFMRIGFEQEIRSVFKNKFCLSDRFLSFAINLELHSVLNIKIDVKNKIIKIKINFIFFGNSLRLKARKVNKLKVVPNNNVVELFT